MKSGRLIIRNATSGAVMQVLKIVINFLVRTLFIRTLGESALGLNGLFTNMLNLLSLTELGFGAAIVTHMYKPLAHGDDNRVLVLMRIYKTIYLSVGFILMLIGSILMVGIPIITRSYHGPLNVQVIFALYLANVVLSYLLGYKTSVLNADQRSYVVNNSYSMMFLIQSFLQAVILLFFKNFYLYLIIAIFGTVFQNVYVRVYVGKRYPFLKRISGFASRQDIMSVTDYVKPLLVYQVSGVVNNSTDSIVISQFLSVAVVGRYSNYMMVVAALSSLMNSIVSGITSTIGNVASTKPERLFGSFKKMFNMIAVISLFVALCLSALLSPFVTIWLGSKYVFDWKVSAMFSLTLYVNLMGLAGMVFREATGSFVYRQYLPVVSVIINLAFSMLLVNVVGVGGVLVGTVVSRLATYTWNDPNVLFKQHFAKSSGKFLKKLYFEISMVAVLIFTVARVTSVFAYSVGGFLVLGMIVVLCALAVAITRWVIRY
ncbi:lipopolysaccharide biosynthesis protein [Lacticaseibacillus hulanensis]|uniref:lipopolysaccharide biosynthesis protein n=1 Tax=Lacticaseibacillus hulanensis TaxID=2493111 RepID=UPI000FD89FFF|nr:oligosaccharide flippase family protein [Lacticaseibacillus hulanensis]